MITLFLSLILTSPVHAETKPLACTAIHRSLNQNNNTVENRVALAVEGQAMGQVKYSADLDGKTFVVTEDLKTGDLFGQIIAAPDYKKGTVFRGAADSSGRFTATEVVEFTVFRLECMRAQN